MRKKVWFFEVVIAGKPANCELLSHNAMAQHTLKLILTLNAEERDMLIRDVEAQRRESLKTLLESLLYLPEGAGEPPKEEVFRRMYGREYSRREDYLLRNEYRLLNNRLYEVVARVQALSELSARESRFALALLAGLLDRGLHREFERQAAKEAERALQRHDYETAARISDLQFSVAMNHSAITVDMLLGVRSILAEHRRTLRQAGAVEMEKNKSRQYSIEKMLRTANYPVEDMQEAPDPTPISEFYFHTGMAFRTTGETSIYHAQQAVERIMAVDDTIEEFQPEKMRALNNLALAWSMQGRISEARSVFEQSIDYAAEHGLDVNLGVIFNYSSILIKLGEYRVVLDLRERYRHRIENDARLCHRFESLRCYCHLFLNEPDEAFNALPAASQPLSPIELRYFRYVYLVIPYLHGEAEQALRETLNYTQYFRRTESDPSTYADRELVKLFRKFFTLVVNTPGVPAPRKFAVLKRRMEEYAAEHPDFADYLPRLWLLGEIRRMAGT